MVVIVIAEIFARLVIVMTRSTIDRVDSGQNVMTPILTLNLKSQYAQFRPYVSPYKQTLKLLGSTHINE